MGTTARATKVRGATPRQPRPARHRGPSTTAEAVLGGYRKLTPKEQARVRREIVESALGATAARRRRKPVVAAVTGRALAFEAPSDQLIAYGRDVLAALRAYVPFDGYSPGDESRLDLSRQETLRVLEPLEWLLKTYFRYEVHGLENVPRRGRAIVVSNHGLLPIDGWFLAYEIFRRRGRLTRGLTDWRIFRIPYLRRLFLDMGVVVGSHDNGDALLDREDLLFIMPGGAKEAWKSSRYRYRLLWQGRYGFVRLALRNRAPIIPSANVGTDDTYHVFFDGYTTAYKLLRTRQAFLPISVPVGIGVLPFPVKLVQYVGEPIVFDYPPEAADDPDIVRECQELVMARVYGLIDRGLREREERAAGFGNGRRRR